MTFFIEGTLVRAGPSEQELQQFYELHRDRFRARARISLVQIYFDPKRRSDADSDARNALGVLLASGTAPPIEEIGDRTLIQAEFRDESEQAISSALGADFAQAVFSLKPDEWNGPIASAYGLHLVRVSSLQAGQLRPLAEVRTRVVEEWRIEQEKLARESYLAELRKKHGVDPNKIMETHVAPAVPPKGLDQ
jgi:hypothetical protein